MNAMQERVIRDARRHLSWDRPRRPDELRAERLELLADLKRHDGWKVLLAGLQGHRKNLRETLASGRSMSLETIRDLQARYELLGEFLANPVDFILQFVEADV